MDLGLNFSLDNTPDELSFSLDDVDRAKGDDGIENERYQRPRVYDSLLDTVEFDKALEFVDTINITPGCRYFGFVSGNFIFGDVIEALVRKRKMLPRHITIQTLSMSQDNIDSLYNVMMMVPECTIRIVLSDYFYAHERRKDGLVPYLYDTLDIDDRLDVAFASVHTKIISVETIRGGKFVIDGSANLRSSRNIEQFRLEADPGLYDYVEAFADKVFAAYSTINKNSDKQKSVRAGKLWQLTRSDNEHAERR